MDWCCHSAGIDEEGVQCWAHRKMVVNGGSCWFMINDVVAHKLIGAYIG